MNYIATAISVKIIAISLFDHVVQPYVIAWQHICNLIILIISSIAFSCNNNSEYLPWIGMWMCVEGGSLFSLKHFFSILVQFALYVELAVGIVIPVWFSGRHSCTGNEGNLYRLSLYGHWLGVRVCTHRLLGYCSIVYLSCIQLHWIANLCLFLVP